MKQLARSIYVYLILRNDDESVRACGKRLTACQRQRSRVAPRGV